MSLKAVSDEKRGLIGVIVVALTIGICWFTRRPAHSSEAHTRVANERLERVDTPSPSTPIASGARGLPIEQEAPKAPREEPIAAVMREGGARITGTVLDALGGPIAGAWLRTRSPSNETRLLGITDAVGAFQLNVAPGEHEVTCGATGYARDRAFLSAPSDGHSFVLAAASKIVGVVLEQESRQPIAGLDVSVSSVVEGLGIARGGRTSEDGSFTIDDLAPGAYSLQVISPHWRSEERRIALGLSERSELVELVVRQATRISGAVVVEGKPCALGWVELSGPVHTQTGLDAQGRFVLDGIPRGRSDLTLACEGALARTEPIDVGDTAIERVWELDPGLHVTGLALTSTRKPAAGVSIEVYPIGGPPERSGTRCITDDRGEFTCHGLAPGDYDCAIAPGMPPRGDTVHVTLSAGAPPHITLQIHAEAAIHARMVGGDDFDRRTLLLLAKHPSGATTVGERQGDVFVFAPLALGKYEVGLESGTAQETQRVELTREGQIADVSFKVTGPHVLAGRVVDDLGVGVADAWVRVSGVSAYATLGAPVLTGATGDFAVRGLAPGKYRLSASNGRGQGELEEIASDRNDALVRLLAFSAAAPDSRSEHTEAGR